MFEADNYVYGRKFHRKLTTTEWIHLTLYFLFFFTLFLYYLKSNQLQICLLLRHCDDIDVISKDLWFECLFSTGSIISFDFLGFLYVYFPSFKIIVLSKLFIYIFVRTY